jgi:hypothetical protein
MALLPCVVEYMGCIVKLVLRDGSRFALSKELLFFFLESRV